MKQKIGIVTPTFNRIQKTTRFLDLVTKQSYKDYQVYICDSGSEDGTQELAKNSPKFNLVVCSSSDWWSNATNKGVKQAIDDGCEYILTINDDAIINSSFLEKLLAESQRHETQIIGARVDFSHKPGLVWALGGRNDWGTKNIFRLNHHKVWEDYLPKEVVDLGTIESEILCGNGVLVHKDVFKKIGYYSHKYCPHYHGDSEFILRARKHKISAYVTNNAIVYNDMLDHRHEDKPIEPKTSKQLLKSTVFDKRSNHYYKPTLYIILRYAPFGKKLITAIAYYMEIAYLLFGGKFKNFILNSRLYNPVTKPFFHGLYRFTSKAWQSLNKS